MEQIKAWMAQESLHLFPGFPAGNITLETEKQDLDLDGIADVLVSNPHQGGSGGKVYSAFLTTPRGYRYIATFQGRIRTLPAASGGRIRAVIATAFGAGTALVQLAELRGDGLHRLVRSTVRAGDSGTEEGNRLYNELMNAKVVSSETLTKVFGRDR
jgi:hypothetical protein